MLITTLIFSGCSKNEGTPIQLAGVSFIQAIPSPVNMHLFIGNARVNETALNFGSKLDYANVYPGGRRFTLTNEGNSTIVTEVFGIDAQAGYSLFATGSGSDIRFLLLKDDLTTPEDGKARIRFVNLSPDAPAVDLSVSGQAITAFSDKAFKAFSTFESIAAGDHLTFTINNTATGTMVVNLNDVKIEAGKIYTVYLKGFYAAPTGVMPVSLSVFAHK